MPELLNRVQAVGELQSEFSRLLGTAQSDAISLPPAAYASVDLFALETRAIFEREWICLGRVEETPEPGDYFTTELVGDPLLVVRGADREIRVLSNVCRHKWTQVAAGEGHAEKFVCPYHAWTYGLDGRLLGARFMDRSVGYQPERCGLPQLRTETWHGFIYVNLDPQARPLHEKLSDLEPLVVNYHMQDMRKFTGDDEIWATNWKLLTENFTEGYHTFHTHRKSLQNATPSELTVFGVSAEQFYAFYGRLDPQEPPREPHHPDLGAEQRKTVLMICLYPSHVIALAPERVFYMCLTPLAPDRVRTRWGVASYGEGFDNDTAENVARFYRQVNDEDKERLESIQRGVGARYAGRGPLSWLETANWHFSQYLARKLASASE